MKKRKPPIILVTCLVIFVGVAFAFQYASTSSQAGPQKQEEPSSPIDPVGTPRPTSSTSDVAKQIRSESGPKGGPAEGRQPGGTRPRMPGGRMGGQPSIVMPKMTPSKPVPNESAPAGQWYSSEADHHGGK